MTVQEMKRLGRAELLEIIVLQAEEIEDLRRSGERIQKENTELTRRLNQKTLAVGRAGNLAEASLAVTNLFAEAQKAIDLYLENARRLDEEQTYGRRKAGLSRRRRMTRRIRAKGKRSRRHTRQ